MFKGFSYLLKIIWRIGKKYIIFLMIGEILLNICTFIPIIGSGVILNALMTKQPANIVYVIILVLISLFVMNELNTLVLGYNQNLKAKTFAEFQLFVSDKMSKIRYERLEMSDFLEEREVMYKFFYSNGSGFGASIENGIKIIGNLLTIIIALVTLRKVDSLVTIGLLVCITVNFLYSNHKKKIIFEINKEKVPTERKSTYFMELFSEYAFNKEVRGNNIVGWILKKYKEQLLRIYDYNRRIVTNSNNIIHFSNVISVIQNLLTYIVFMYMFLDNRINIGEFSMFVSTVTLLSTTTKNMLDKVIDLDKLSVFKDGAKRFLEEEEEDFNAELFCEAIDEPSILFDNVSFAYPNSDNYALKNVSFEIKNNEKVCIVGENGAGKSTIIKLMLRLYKPTEGHIYVNDIDIWNMDIETYRQMFSTVFQDFKLFCFSIKENICLGYDTSDDKVENILYECGLDLDEDRATLGVHTNVYKVFDNMGYVPSGGEAQKIALARALFKMNASIIILDEPTAALDPRAEYELYQKFDELSLERTTIYITHRLSSCRLANKIIVIREGKIEQIGSHKELIDINGEYSKLYNMQAQYYKPDLK